MVQRLHAGKRRDGGVEVVLAGADGTTRLAARVGPDGTPSLVMFGADGETIWQAPVSPKTAFGSRILLQERDPAAKTDREPLGQVAPTAEEPAVETVVEGCRVRLDRRRRTIRAVEGGQRGGRERVGQVAADGEVLTGGQRGVDRLGDDRRR